MVARSRLLSVLVLVLVVVVCLAIAAKPPKGPIVRGVVRVPSGCEFRKKYPGAKEFERNQSGFFEHLSLERMDPDFVPEIRWYDANGRMVRKDVIAPHDAETIASLCEHRGLIRSPNRRWIAD